MRLLQHALLWAPWLAQEAVAGVSGNSTGGGLLLTPDAGGRVRTFDLTITWETHAPDGFARKMALINGQYPGPLIEVDEGDVVAVWVHNEMPDNTTVRRAKPWHVTRARDYNTAP